MDGLDSEAIARTNLDSRAVTTTATIGSLPLTSFIYILTATFVFLICLLPLVKFFLAVRIGPAYYYERYLGTGSTSVSRDEQEKPNFRQSQGGGPGHLESLARIAIDKSPMQATLYTPPPVHNLPLPIGDLAIIPADKTVEVLSLDHLYDTQELWAEKKRLDSSIHNLWGSWPGCGVEPAGPEEAAWSIPKERAAHNSNWCNLQQTEGTEEFVDVWGVELDWTDHAGIWEKGMN